LATLPGTSESLSEVKIFLILQMLEFTLVRNLEVLLFFKVEKPKPVIIQKCEPKKIGKAAESALAAGYR